MTPSPSPRSSRFTPSGLWASAVLLGVTIAAYLPALRAGFVWDDDSSLTQNHFIQSAGGLGRFWFSTQTPDYWPMTASTFWLEWRLWGLNPLGYHATNLALHVAEAFLLWAILRRLRVPGAFLGALLFAVHPVNVESVAWITQRKNLMAMLFYLASLYAFLRTPWFAAADPAGFERTLAAARGKPDPWPGRWYWLSLAAFVLAMLSKGSVAMLPVVLLGLILWHRRLERGDLLRAAPFFAVGAGLALVNVWFQRHGADIVIREAGFGERLLGAGAVVWFYLFKALWPANLIFVYPQWQVRVNDLLWRIPLLAVIGMTGLLYGMARLRPRRGSGAANHAPALARGAWFAWGYFCVALVPVLGFSDVYFMKFSLVADHYQHLALIGVVAFAGAAWERWRIGSAGRPLATLPEATAVAVVAALALLTYRQSATYQDSTTLFRATLARNPAAWMAHNNLGNLLRDAGQLPAAAEEYRATLALKPDFAEAHSNLGGVLRVAGHLPEAMAEYGRALRLDPGVAEVHYDLGLTLRAEGRLPDAIAEYREALRLHPANLPQVEDSLGNALALSGQLPEAISHYAAAVQLAPDDPKIRSNLGSAYARAGRLPEATAQFERVVQLSPNDSVMRNFLGIALAQTGRLPEAAVQFEQAVRLSPNDPGSHRNLGRAYRALGRLPEAESQFEAALALEYPAASAPAKNRLGN